MEAGRGGLEGLGKRKLGSEGEGESESGGRESREGERGEGGEVAGVEMDQC